MKEVRMKPISGEEAVSPVVGVMLMLVVTIIIAAVVSGFAGGLGSETQKAPSVSIDTKIVNTGYWQGSGMSMRVVSVSEPILTADIKIVTRWTTTNKTAGDGSIITGGATSLPGVNNTKYTAGDEYPAPIGFGPGVEDWSIYQTIEPEQTFGKYSLLAGTIMRAYPLGPFAGFAAAGGYGPNSPTYEYVSGVWYVVGLDNDSMQAVLGDDWNHLRAGDVVNVRIVHTPSEKVIYDNDITVEGY